jgi:hypothetical protein
VCYLDGFLITSQLVVTTGGASIDTTLFEYPAMNTMKSLLQVLKESVDSFRTQINSNFGQIEVFQGNRYTGNYFATESVNLDATLVELTKMVVPTEKPRALRLQESSIPSFRNGMYKIYATDEQKKLLFMRLLNTFLRVDASIYIPGDDPDKVIKYSSRGGGGGEQNTDSQLFRCLTCETPTPFVDLRLELAFCCLSCRKTFLSSKHFFFFIEQISE